ncbi:MAG: DnaT-like ssDNA-binding protein [Dehalococcoidia bacterium]
MALKLEDGTGVSGANAYVDSPFVLAYLTERNREAENLWSTIGDTDTDGAIVAATDFIEQRWGLRFLGLREFRDISAARATLTLTGQPDPSFTITIGSTLFTWGTTGIGVSVEATIDNMVAAVNLSGELVSAVAGTGDTMIVEADAKGTSGNAIISTESGSNTDWSSVTLIGGADPVIPQPLSFPRLQLLDREGLRVNGIPLRLKQATAEYAVRSLSSALMPDPVIDETGRAVFRKRDKVGPIEEERWYEDGAAISQLIRPYPAADRLLAEYVSTGGRVVRA